MLHIAVCDDNAVELSQIVSILKKIDTFDFEIHKYLNPCECLEEIASGKMFDCFLLDILMNKDNGINIARKIRQTHVDTPIIFITATPKYALAGYEVSAARYYLKPLDEKRFTGDLIRILEHAHSRLNDYMTVTNTNGITRIYLKDIYYIESMLRTVIIHTKDASHSMTAKISDLEEQLSGHDFVRVHKSFLVNLRYIHNIYKNTITLDNQEEILLSKHRSKEVHETLVKYIQENV